MPKRDPTPALWFLGNLTIDDIVQWDGTIAMGVCGGNAVFAAVGAAVWQPEVGIAARVGRDFPLTNLEALERAGLVLVLSKVDTPSIHNWALYESPEARQFINWSSSGTYLEQSIQPRELPLEIDRAAGCHVAPMPIEVQVQLVERLAVAAPVVSLDPHEAYIVQHEGELLDVLKKVDIFLPSRREAQLLFGRDDPESAARHFVRAGARIVAIKLGGEGSVVMAAGQDTVRHVPAIPVDVVDPTGAGDSYCGGFLAAYCRGADPFLAACHGTVSASFVVEQRGAYAVLPIDVGEAQRRLEWLTGRPPASSQAMRSRLPGPGGVRPSSSTLKEAHYHAHG